MQMCQSGTSVSARRPERSPPSSTIVPVSAIASAQPVSTPSSSSSARGDERRVVHDDLDALEPGAGPPGGHGDPRRAALRGRRRDRVGAGRRRSTRVTVARVLRHPLAEAVDDVRCPPARRRRRRGSARGTSAPPRRRRARRGRARGPQSAASPTPPVPERLLGRLGQLAHRRPARQRRASRAARARAARAAARARSARAIANTRRDRRHRQPPRATAPLLLAHDPPAQVHEQRRDLDLDRAGVVARAAQRRRPRQRRVRVEPEQLRRQDRADRPRIDRLVRLPADARVDRAHVQAGRAADAVQRLRGRPRRRARRCGRRRAARGGTPAARRRAARRSTATCTGSSARPSRSAAAAAGRPRGRATPAAPSRSPSRSRAPRAASCTCARCPRTRPRTTVPVSATPKFAPLTADRHREELRAQVLARRLGDAPRPRSPRSCPARSCARTAPGSPPGCGGSRARGCATACRRASWTISSARSVSIALMPRSAERLVEADLVGGQRLDLDDLVARRAPARCRRRSRSPRRRRAPSAPSRPRASPPPPGARAARAASPSRAP